MKPLGSKIRSSVWSLRYLLEIQVEMSNVPLDILVSGSEQRSRMKGAILVFEALRLGEIIFKSEDR